MVFLALFLSPLLSPFLYYFQINVFQQLKECVGGIKAVEFGAASRLAKCGQCPSIELPNLKWNSLGFIEHSRDRLVGDSEGKKDSLPDKRERAA